MKKELRKKYLEIRNNYSIEYQKEASKKIVDSILLLTSHLEQKGLGLFYKFGSEIDLVSLLENNSLVYIEGDNILFSLTNGDYKPNKYGILECTNTKTTKPYVIIIPAIIYNNQGYRLGYGGGYYDRYLKSNDCLKIGVIYDDLIQDIHFEESYDEKVDYIISEKRIIKIND